MKDRINKEKPHLGQTIKSIGLMHASLASLHARVYPESPLWFALQAQGPIDDLRALLDDLEWLMEDMVPQELREQAALLETATEPVAQKQAA